MTLQPTQLIVWTGVGTWQQERPFCPLSSMCLDLRQARLPRAFNSQEEIWSGRLDLNPHKNVVSTTYRTTDDA
jgi:hypothetical protein